MENQLPQDFVYLKDIDPSVVQSVRYGGFENFLARPVPGYLAPKIILTHQAAQALKNVQESVKKEGYSLVVYDAYRPQQAVDAFIAWSQDTRDQTAKPLYCPTVNKAEAFQLGYLAKKSAHSRGSTVDLSLIPLDTSLHPIVISHRTLSNGETIPFLDDGSVDMGSSFDLFHEVSSHDTPLISNDHAEKRDLLRRFMKQQGFKEYIKEWWHYALENEPYPDTYFDFVIE